MARLNKYLVLVALLVISGCEHEQLSPSQEIHAGDVFNQLGISRYDYTVELATKGGLPSYSDIQGELLCEMALTPRDAGTKSSFDDIVWDGHDSKVGIYLIDHVEEGTEDWDQIVNNNHTKVTIVDGEGSGKSVNKGLASNKIQLSSKEILEYIKHYKEGDPWQDKSVDVMAYFPYAEQILTYVSLTNISNSIVGIFNPTDSRNVVKLPFTMKPTQTDDNIWYHDLMVSVREKGSDAEGSMNIYGNIGKFNRSTYSGDSITGYYDMEPKFRDDRSEITCDNVHLRMQHMFAKLNITFNIDERFDGETVNRLYVDGSKVYSYGEINMITGKVTPGGVSTIDRLIPREDEVVSHTKPLKTVMLLCPCQIEADGEMVLHITIGGVEYTCDFHKLMSDVDIKACYEYNLNLSFSKNNSLKVVNGYGGTVACVQHYPGDYDKFGTYGERWIIPESTTDYPKARIGSNIANWLVVSPKLGYKMKGIYVNGELVPPSPDNSTPLTKPSDGYRIRDDIDAAGGTKMKHYYCKLDVVHDKNTWYEVVYVPVDDWYVRPDNIIQQFDGIYNNGICDPSQASTVPNIAIWKDISGHNRDAQLHNVMIDETATSVNNWRETIYDQDNLGDGVPYTSYETTQQSGWVAGGLKLDGVNDYITFPASLPARDNNTENGDFNMTIDMYLCVEAPQCGTNPRILCEADPGLTNSGTTTFTSHGYPSLVLMYDDNLNASSSNVKNLYNTKSGTVTVRPMGFGNNYGVPSPNMSQKTKCTSHGNEIIHIVWWYRGGYGNITDMDIYKNGHTVKNVTGDLGGGDIRNAYLVMVEYVEPAAPSVIKRGFLEFYGYDEEHPEIDYKISTDLGLPNEGDEYNFRQLTLPLLKEHINNSQNINCYLEDAFAPIERWACIGGRANDYTRQLNATVFSFIMYDGLLTFGEVEKNYALHRRRFGYAKTVIPTPPQR